MTQLQHFSNDGFGWVCRKCEDKTAAPATDYHRHPRSFREGEAESKQPVLANHALARWMDKERRFLICPRCGVTEDTFIN